MVAMGTLLPGAKISTPFDNDHVDVPLGIDSDGTTARRENGAGSAADNGTGADEWPECCWCRSRNHRRAE